jgi:hypothetical protein
MCANVVVVKDDSLSLRRDEIYGWIQICGWNNVGRNIG